MGEDHKLQVVKSEADCGIDFPTQTALGLMKISGRNQDARGVLQAAATYAFALLERLEHREADSTKEELELARAVREKVSTVQVAAEMYRESMEYADKTVAEVDSTATPLWRKKLEQYDRRAPRH